MNGDVWGFAAAIALIFTGIILNQVGLRELGARLDRVAERIDRVQSDLAQFYRSLGQHDARLDNID